MTTTLTDLTFDMLPDDGGTYIVDTEHSRYIVDTARKLATRENIPGNNPREYDDVARTYDHIAVDLDCPIVIHYTSYGWVHSTLVTRISAQS